MVLDVEYRTAGIRAFNLEPGYVVTERTIALGGGGERRLAVLGRSPDLAALGRPAGGGVHHLHAGVVLVRVAVDRLDLALRSGQRRLGVALAAADGGLGRDMQHDGAEGRAAHPRIGNPQHVGHALFEQLLLREQQGAVEVARLRFGLGRKLYWRFYVSVQ